MRNDRAIIADGKAAWNRIKRSKSFEDWLAIGAALIVGRKLCMREAGVDIPHGWHYSRIHKEWLEKTGFCEIHRAMRIGAMLCAKNNNEVQAWWISLPPRYNGNSRT